MLVLGGGDGLAVREVLKYPERALGDAGRSRPGDDRAVHAIRAMLAALNRGSLPSPKVHVVNADAFRWLRANQRRFDAVLVDFPDPTNFSIGKLYTDSFYRELARALAPGAVVSVQSTSPLVAPQRLLDRVDDAGGGRARPRAAITSMCPSFGEWGFVLAAHGPIADAGAAARRAAVPDARRRPRSPSSSRPTWRGGRPR